MSADSSVSTPAGPAPIGVTANPPAGSGFTEPQLREMARWAVQDGLLTRQRAAEMLRADGVDARPEDFAPVEQIPGDPLAAPGFEPGGFEEFQLPQIGDATTPLTEIINFDRQIREWFTAAKLPPAIGNFIAAEAARTMTTFESMNETSRAIWSIEQAEIVRRTLGPETAAKVSLARDLIAELDARFAGLADYLDETGLSHSAAIIVQLAEHAARLKDRQQARDAARPLARR